MVPGHTTLENRPWGCRDAGRAELGVLTQPRTCRPIKDTHPPPGQAGKASALSGPGRWGDPGSGSLGLGTPVGGTQGEEKETVSTLSNARTKSSQA